MRISICSCMLNHADVCWRMQATEVGAGMAHVYISLLMDKLTSAPGTQFTCFTSAKEQILTQKLVQKYKY